MLFQFAFRYTTLSCH